MVEGAPSVKLRQVVLVAHDLESLAGELRGALSLGEPFRDPGVAEFGLANVVYAIGGCFLEVVSPIAPGTAAGRHLKRTGRDSGYMVLFDLEDLDGARARAQRMGIRVVWQIDLAGISGTHLHPSDTRGAIVSLDRSAPYGTWRWGGPGWTDRTGDSARGRLSAITVSVAEPTAVAARWGELLGVDVSPNSEMVLGLDDAEVRFTRCPEDAAEGIVEIELELPAEIRGVSETIELGGVRLSLRDLEQ